MEVPPPYRSRISDDEDQLNLLAIFHFIGAGLAAVALLFLGAHFLFFSAITSNPPFLTPPGGRLNFGPPQGPPFPFQPTAFFLFFKLFYLVGGIWLLVSCVLNVLSGLWLRARVHRNRSIVVAAIDLLHVPLGTILGVFTIVILSRNSVRRLYGE